MNQKHILPTVAITVGFLTFGHLYAEAPKLLQSQAKALIMIGLQNNGSTGPSFRNALQAKEYTGTAAQMNAIAVPLAAPFAETFDISINPKVGVTMLAATEEVEKFMRIRHGKDLPIGHRIEFDFIDHHTFKDSPSAAVACALIAESIITGEGIQPSFAVSGNITADGKVRAIGDITAKVRGAAKRDCKVIAVPLANKAQVDDIYVLEGINSIINNQIILIENFEQAWDIGRGERSKKIQKALDDYDLVRTSIKHTPANISHPHVREKLKSIVDVIPNHKSASLIALHSIGKGPKKLSLAGSIQAIQGAAKELNNTIASGNHQGSGINSPLWVSVSSLTRLRDNVDPRTKDYLNAFLKTATLLKEFIASGKKQWTNEQQREFNSLVLQIQNEESKIMNNIELREELIDQ